MKNNLLICATSSINIINITHYIIELKRYFNEVNILLSPNSKKFLSIELLNTFCDNIFDESSHPFINHVNLANLHEKVIVLPCSANTIGKIANGICDNLLTTVCLTAFNKLYIFPNMNLLMWNNPFLQENLEKLKNNNIKVYIPNKTKSYEISSGVYKENISMPEVSEVIKFTLNF
ncbi:phosphopantothenate--cysteine ligase family flavoprotein [Staphylococcus felis]|uniref:flavoprotein n=1 Tax=Staphylococcus felis TaxID=46127 RepID=UPI0039671CB0